MMTAVMNDSTSVDVEDRLSAERLVKHDERFASMLAMKPEAPNDLDDIRTVTGTNLKPPAPIADTLLDMADHDATVEVFSESHNDMAAPGAIMESSQMSPKSSATDPEMPELVPVPVSPIKESDFPTIGEGVENLTYVHNILGRDKFNEMRECGLNIAFQNVPPNSRNMICVYAAVEYVDFELFGTRQMPEIISKSKMGLYQEEYRAKLIRHIHAHFIIPLVDKIHDDEDAGRRRSSANSSSTMLTKRVKVN